MIIEVQFAKEQFISTVRRGFKARRACVLPPFDISFLGQCYVDHVEITDDTSLERVPIEASGSTQPNEIVPTSVLCIKQQVQLPLVPLVQLEANGADATPPILTPDLYIKFKISVQLVADTPALSFTFAGSELGNLLSGLPDEQRAQIQAALNNNLGAGVSNIPLDLWGSSSSNGQQPSVFQDVADQSGGVSHAGIMLSAQADVVAIRLEIGTNEDSQTKWRDFYDGNVPDSLNGHQWSIFVDKDLIARSISKEIATQSSYTYGDTTVGIDGSSTEWRQTGVKVTVKTTAVVGGAPNSGGVVTGGQSVGLEFYFDVNMSVPSPGQLHSELTWDYDFDDWDIARSILESIFVGAWVGLWFGPWGALIGGVAGAIGAGIAWGVSSDIGDIPMVDTYWEDAGNKKYVHDDYFRISNRFIGRMSLLDIIPNADGLQIVGDITPPRESAPQVVDTQCAAFSFDITRSCGEGPGINAYACLLTGSEPCSTSILEGSDQYGVYSGPYDSTGRNTSCCNYRPVETGLIALTFVASKDKLSSQAFIDQPYDCKILLRTVDGTRLIKIPPPALPPVPSPEEEQKQALQEVLWRLSCMTTQSQFYGIKALEVRWLPYPPPDQAVLHRWDVTVDKLHTNEAIALADHEGREIVSMRAVSAGKVTVSAVLARNPVSNNVTLLLRSSDRTSDDEMGNISVRQRLLVPEATLRSVSPISSISSAEYRGVPCLFAISALGLNVYNLNRPELPRLQQLLDSPGLKGAMPWNKGILAWGDNGVTRLKDTGERTQILPGTPVHDVFELEKKVCVVTDEGASVLDTKLRQVDTLPLKRLEDVREAGTIAAKDDHYIHIFDVTEDRTHKRIYSQPLDKRITTLSRRGIQRFKDAVFVEEDGGRGYLATFGGTGKLIEVARYPSAPWFINAAQVGSALARVGNEGHSVEIYRTAWDIRRM